MENAAVAMGIHMGLPRKTNTVIHIPALIPTGSLSISTRNPPLIYIPGMRKKVKLWRTKTSTGMATTTTTATTIMAN